ncbi:MAG: outer membrane protein assembly factor, partial [Flavobacterium sp.]
STTYFEGGVYAKGLTIEGVNLFLADVNNNTIQPSSIDAKSINSIVEQRTRLTEDNLIFATSITLSKTSQKDLADNNFYAFKGKIESAGNLISLLAEASKLTQNGSQTAFGVEFSQYI